MGLVNDTQCVSFSGLGAIFNVAHIHVCLHIHSLGLVTSFCSSSLYVATTQFVRTLTAKIKCTCTASLLILTSLTTTHIYIFIHSEYYYNYLTQQQGYLHSNVCCIYFLIVIYKVVQLSLALRSTTYTI